MKKVAFFVLIAVSGLCAQAAWYWPFSSDEEKPPRISELMEPASVLIDEAVDLAAENKDSEAVEKYREALKELDRIEAENPDRAQLPEFMTLKHKRAYVNTAIDSLLLHQAQLSAKPVAVSDTTELQKKYEARRAGVKVADEAKSAETEVKAPTAGGEKAAAEVNRAKPEPDSPKPEAAKAAAGTYREKLQLAVSDLKRKDYASVDLMIKELLEEKPNDAAALNLKAVSEISRGDAAAAEKTLDAAIMSNPRSYHAYYNMARLMLRHKGNRSSARRYYETGRTIGGPVDGSLEGLLK